MINPHGVVDVMHVADMDEAYGTRLMMNMLTIMTMMMILMMMMLDDDTDDDIYIIV